MSQINMRPKILIVDDLSENLDILREILDDQDYTILTTSESRQVISIILEEHPDLILLDVLMPELDGFELCQIIKEHEQIKSIPIIFISGLNDVQSRLKGFEVGGIDFISKPFHDKEVLIRVKTHIERSIYKKEIENRLHLKKAELEHVQEAFNQSQAYYQSFILNSHEGIYCMGLTPPLPIGLSAEEEIEYLIKNLKFIDVNNKFFEMYGYKSKIEIVGKSVYDFLSIYCPVMREIFQSFIENSYQFPPTEVVEIHPGNRKKYFIKSSTGIFKEQRLEQIWGTQIDISKRKIAEKQLIKSEEKYIRILDSIQSDYFLYSLTPDGNFSYVTPSIKNILGYTDIEFLSHFSQFIDLSDHEFNHLINFELSLKGDQQGIYRIPFKHKNGGIKTVEIKDTLIFDKAGNLTSIEGIAHDISPRLEYEKKLSIFKIAVDQSQNLILWTTLEGEIVYANNSHFEVQKPS